MKIAVVGLANLGLPLSLQFARTCVIVLGLDKTLKKVQLLNEEADPYQAHRTIDHRGVREFR